MTRSPSMWREWESEVITAGSPQRASRDVLLSQP